MREASLILEKTHKETIKSFVYKSETALQEAQKTLIEFAHILINNSDQMNEDLREINYKCLKSIFNRGELVLNSLGYHDYCNSSIK